MRGALTPARGPQPCGRRFHAAAATPESGRLQDVFAKLLREPIAACVALRTSRTRALPAANPARSLRLSNTT